MCMKWDTILKWFVCYKCQSSKTVMMIEISDHNHVCYCYMSREVLHVKHKLEDFFVVLDDSFWLLVTWICYGSHSLANMFLAEQKRIRVHKSKAHVGSCRNIVVNMKVWKYAENLLDSLICRQIHSSIQMACKWATQSEQDWNTMAYCSYSLSNIHHYMEGETMRVMLSLLVMFMPTNDQ